MEDYICDDRENVKLDEFIKNASDDEFNTFLAYIKEHDELPDQFKLK